MVKALPKIALGAWAIAKGALPIIQSGTESYPHVGEEDGIIFCHAIDYVSTRRYYKSIDTQFKE